MAGAPGSQALQSARAKWPWPVFQSLTTALHLAHPTSQSSQHVTEPAQDGHGWTWNASPTLQGTVTLWAKKLWNHYFIKSRQPSHQSRSNIIDVEKKWNLVKQWRNQSNSVSQFSIKLWDFKSNFFISFEAKQKDFHQPFANGSLLVDQAPLGTRAWWLHTPSLPPSVYFPRTQWPGEGKSAIFGHVKAGACDTTHRVIGQCPKCMRTGPHPAHVGLPLPTTGRAPLTPPFSELSYSLDVRTCPQTPDIPHPWAHPLHPPGRIDLGEGSIGFSPGRHTG